MSPARRTARLGAALVPLVAALLSQGGVAAATRSATGWRPPVPGPVVGPFSFDRAAPFAGGARRGVDLQAAAGDPVRAACSGRVTFAGRTPQGRGVTVRCSGLAATHLGLGRLAARAGERVRRGQRLGTSAGARVRWGARRVGDRFGWLDPTALVRRLRAPPVAPMARPPASARPSPSPAPRVAPAPGPASATTPLAAWLALALVAAGVPAVAVRARPRPARRVAPAPGPGLGPGWTRGP